MGRTTQIVLVAAWAALIAFGVWRKWLYKVSVAGGPVLVYEVDVEHAFEPGAKLEERTAEALRSRAERLTGAAEALVSGSRVEVRVPRSAKLDVLKRLLARPARVELKRVDDGSDLMKIVATGLRREVQPDVEIGHDGWSERASGAEHRDIYLRAPTLEALSAALAGAKLPADHQFAFERVEARDEEGSSGPDFMWRSYYVYRKAEVSNADIEDVDVNWDPQTGRPEVSVKFTREGGEHFADMTGSWVGRKLAIILDDRIQSAPVIETRITGGRARITMGGFGDPQQLQQEAKDLVAVLRVGALPAPIKLVEER
jgi:preprotein translocase subunit SecD